MNNPIVCRGCYKELNPKGYTDEVIMHKICPQCMTKIRMAKNDFAILVRERKNEHNEQIEFQAFNKSFEAIFGASAEIYRRKSFRDFEWENWEISYGCTSGDRSYKAKLPYVTAINMAMDKLKELTKS